MAGTLRTRRSPWPDPSAPAPLSGRRRLPGTGVDDIRRALLHRVEIALLDVRSEARFSDGHPLFAASLPLDRLEAEAGDRLPRRSAPVVVYGDDEDHAVAASRRLRDLGYGDVRLLDGGLPAWRVAGRELFRDVNVPSKAFGELVAASAATPMVDPRHLHSLLEDGADVVVVDVRRPDEFATMSIPTAVNVPGGDLVLRIGAVAPDPATAVVVNCAGRTRSIVGAQSLVNAGIPNPVAALRNGTIGWTLAGLALEHGRDSQAPRRWPDGSPDRSRPGRTGLERTGRARAAARALAHRAGVGRMDLDDVTAVVADGRRTVYRFDVRSPAEYGAGHVPGFRHAPGGQLVQETDHFAPVQGALVVLADDDGVRADMAASWLAQMGWHVAVLVHDPRRSQTERRAVGPADAGPGRPRPGPAAAVAPGDRYRRPYEGTDVPAEAMQAYLEWEHGLVDQLRRDGTHDFRLLT